MRIVSGKYGGRKLIVPKGRDIRPTGDKVRGAVFNMLRSLGAVEGAQVLDVFCGTGALGLEALSQGAAGCTFIDKSRTALDLARDNAAVLGVEEEAAFILKDATRPIGRSTDVTPADLVFLDPPYDKNLIAAALHNLIGQNWLIASAVIIIEEDKDFDFRKEARAKIEEWVKNIDILDERIYGDTKIMLLRYKGATVNTPP